MEFIKTDPKEFNRQLSFSKRLEFFTIYTNEELDTCDLYVSIGGGVGFGLAPDKEIINLFNNTGTKLCGREALDFAIAKGGRKVCCFDVFFAKYSEAFGFKEYDRAAWNPSLAPLNWKYNEYGKPDVVWLKLKRYVLVPGSLWTIKRTY